MLEVPSWMIKFVFLLPNLQKLGNCTRQLSQSRKRVDCIWNVMAHAQKPDFVFRRNGRVCLNRRWRQLSRLLTAEVCGSAIMLDTPCSEVVWRILTTHSIRRFPFHSLSCVAPCAITFQLVYNIWTHLRQVNTLSRTGMKKWPEMRRVVKLNAFGNNPFGMGSSLTQIKRT